MRLLIVGVAAFGFSAQTLGAEPTALDRCARLLPEGKTYTFKIEGTAVHNSPVQTTVERSIGVGGKYTTVLPKGITPPADSKADTEAFGKEIEPFYQCLQKAY